MRNSIQDFSLANPIYAGATVNFYTVSGGVKTATLATLYAASTGSTTLSNPQSLDSSGKFQQPVYVDAPVIATVSGLTIADHDTGIIQAVLSAGSVADVLTTFSASSGSSLIGTIQAGVGAVASTVQAKLRKWIFVMDFAVAGDGVGFPDTVLVRERVVWVELKSDVGKLSDEQEVWRDKLFLAKQEWYLWRPRDWPTIQTVLAR